jgi:biofilm protein TabA
MIKSVLPAMLFMLLAASLLLSSCTASKPYGQESASTAKWFEGKTWLNGLQLKPHKTINQQEFKKQYEANPLLWNKAFSYLKETNLAALKPGKHLIEGETVFALVTEGPAKSADTAKWEGHQQYIDIHYVISGKENIGLAPITSATVITPYDGARDIGFYKADGKFYEADTETFFLVFPEEAHLPGIKVNGYHNPVKKIVIKVKKA